MADIGWQAPQAPPNFYIYTRVKPGTCTTKGVLNVQTPSENSKNIVNFNLNTCTIEIIGIVSGGSNLFFS